MITILHSGGRTDEMLGVYRQFRTALPPKPREIPDTDVEVAPYLEQARRMADAATVLDGILHFEILLRRATPTRCAARFSTSRPRSTRTTRGLPKH